MYPCVIFVLGFASDERGFLLLLTLIVAAAAALTAGVNINVFSDAA